MAIWNLVCIMQSGILHLEKRSVKYCKMIYSSKVLQYPLGSQVGVSGFELTIWADLVEIFCDFVWYCNLLS